jgi:GNAT superfamily N-acetyltransferase
MLRGRMAPCQPPSPLSVPTQTHLESFYPPESRHGFSVERLIKEGVAFFVLRVDGAPAGCGGIKLFDRQYGELKRMYVRPEFRGRKYGELLVEHLAEHARANGVTLLRLETGIHQQAAIRLYERLGFRRIPPFGPYTDDPVSRCYEKSLALGSKQDLTRSRERAYCNTDRAPRETGVPDFASPE